MKKALFSTAYLPPLEYFFYLLLQQDDPILIDTHEHFTKQTYRNRCQILSPNGLQNLSVPRIHSKQHQAIKDVSISYHENWQKIHWKSLEAAYRRSPYFEYYEDHFAPFYHEKKYKFLYDLNEALLNTILELISLTVSFSKTTHYISNNDEAVQDYRNTMHPKRKNNSLTFSEYLQVFGHRNGFHANLSIIDLLFNEGPNSLSYLKNNIKPV